MPKIKTTRDHFVVTGSGHHTIQMQENPVADTDYLVIGGTKVLSWS